MLTDYRHLGYVIAVLILLGLLGILWLSNRVVRQTISPINRMLDTTRHITEGNYAETIPLSNQNDDIGHLQNALASMQQKLHDHMGSIRQTAEALKKRNEQRARDMELAEETVKKKTLFIQNLSHQIRTPLNIIIGFANVLHESIVSRNKKDAAMSPIQEDKMNEMSDLMKHNAVHLKRMVLMLFDSLSTTSADELMANRHDEVSCNDVAREMLYNAAKFSDGKHIKLYITQNDTSVFFTVEDVGPGLAGNADELIYKPFAKIDDLTDGLGLGLPLTKRHALSLGGDLTYDDSYHGGCRFIIEMPK